MKKKFTLGLALAAVLSTGLVLGACAPTATSTDSSSSTSTSEQQGYTATRVNIAMNLPTQVVIGSTVDFDEYITVAAPESGTFGLNVTTGNGTVDGHKVTVTGSGTLTVQIIGANDSIIRALDFDTVSESANEVINFLTSLSNDYLLLLDSGIPSNMQEGAYVSGEIYHRPQYFAYLAGYTLASQEESVVCAVYMGVLDTNAGRSYNFSYYEGWNATLAAGGMIQSLDSRNTAYDNLKVEPGAINNTFYLSQPLSIRASSVSYDEATETVSIDNTALNQIIQCGYGLVDLSMEILADYGYVSNTLTIARDEETGEEIGLLIDLLNEDAELICEILITNDGESNKLAPVEDYIASNKEPDPIENTALDSFIADVRTNKTPYTVTSKTGYEQMSLTTGKYSEITDANTLQVFDNIGASTFAPEGTTHTYVNGTTVYSEGGTNREAYVPNDDGILYYIASQDSGENWKSQQFGQSADETVWGANPYGYKIFQGSEDLGYQYLSLGALTDEILSGIVYTGFNTSTTGVVTADWTGSGFGSFILGSIPFTGYIYEGWTRANMSQSSSEDWSMYLNGSLEFDPNNKTLSVDTYLIVTSDDDYYYGIHNVIEFSDFGTDNVPTDLASHIAAAPATEA